MRLLLQNTKLDIIKIEETLKFSAVISYKNVEKFREDTLKALTKTLNI